MTEYWTGQTASLTVQWSTYPGGPAVDVTGVAVTISPVGGGAPVVGPTGVGITHEALGLYSYEWAVPAGTVPGDYVVLWTATDGDGDAVQASEVITVQLAVTGDGPCGWMVLPACAEWSGYTATIQDAALHLSTTHLWAATGRRYGMCPVTVRPVRSTGADAAYREYVLRPGETGGSGYSAPGALTPFTGAWRNCGCGTGCCCRPECSVVLAGPVYSVTDVVVDGVTVSTDSYRVDVARGAYRLVRTDGSCWPTCQDPIASEGEEGAFSVTYEIGVPPPGALLTAAGLLACEYARGLTGGVCQLPSGMTRLSRQGVEVEVEQPPSGGGWMTGIREVDDVIVTLNPSGRRMPPVVLSPDLDEYCDRRTVIYPGGS